MTKVDNLESLGNYLFRDFTDDTKNISNDWVVLGRIIRRKKENPDKKEYIVKRYTFRSKEKYLETLDEIRTLCDIFNARFYVSINIKSLKSIALDTLVYISKLISLEEYYPIKKCFDNAADSNKGISGYKRFILDIDIKGKENQNIVLDKLLELGKDEFANSVELVLPTINGIHLIVKPHDIRYLYSEGSNFIEGLNIHLDQIVEVKKNALTLGYFKSK